MNLAQSVRGLIGRMRSGSPERRRTQPLPSILSVHGPRPDTLPKATPANLRRFGETPVARKAINTIKDRLVGMRWDIQPRSSRQARELPDGPERIRILSANLDHPNPDDSFRSLIEPVVEDVIVGGFGAIEIQNTGDPEQPLLLWPVDGATIKIPHGLGWTSGLAPLRAGDWACGAKRQRSAQ